MEVFVPFDGSLDAVPFLEQVLDGWNKVRFAMPIALEFKPGPKFNIQCRVAADNIAKGLYYIYADIDAKIEEPWIVSQVQKRLGQRPLCGMAFIRPLFDIGGRVRIVRKGIVKKWPKQETDNYDLEFGKAIIDAGYTVETWDDIHYRHLPHEKSALVIN